MVDERDDRPVRSAYKWMICVCVVCSLRTPQDGFFSEIDFVIHELAM